MYISWTQIYLSLWHISFSSSLYMTLFKLCHLECIPVGFVRPFYSSGAKVESHQVEWQKLCLVKSRGSQHQFKRREQKQSRELQTVCWERLQENSKAAFLCGQDMLTGQWSEETPGRDLHLQRQTLASVVSFLLGWHLPVWMPREDAGQVLGFCDNPEGCHSLYFWYTNHMWQQREVFKSPFPPHNGTLSKGNWGLLPCLAVLLEQYLGCSDPFFPSYKGKINRREGSAGRKVKGCIFFLHDHISSPHLHRL